MVMAQKTNKKYQEENTALRSQLKKAEEDNLKLNKMVNDWIEYSAKQKEMVEAAVKSEKTSEGKRKHCELVFNQVRGFVKGVRDSVYHRSWEVKQDLNLPAQQEEPCQEFLIMDYILCSLEEYDPDGTRNSNYDNNFMRRNN
jgi:hypothetical protein